MSIFKIKAAASEILDAVNALDQQAEHPTWRERYEWLCESIIRLQQEAQILYEDMQQNGLKFSSVEAEGYLRAMKNVVNEIARIDEHFVLNDIAEGEVPVPEIAIPVQAPQVDSSDSLSKEVRFVISAINGMLAKYDSGEITITATEQTLFNLGFDEIAAVELMLDIEDGLKIQFDDEFEKQYPDVLEVTVQDLINYVTEKT